MAYGFRHNHICFGGTGAFLDALVARLGIRIEDFGDIALKGQSKVNIVGKCTVFATTSTSSIPGTPWKTSS